jgi:hypothetical protein
LEDTRRETGGCFLWGDVEIFPEIVREIAPNMEAPLPFASLKMIAMLGIYILQRVYPLAPRPLLRFPEQKLLLGGELNRLLSNPEKQKRDASI